MGKQRNKIVLLGWMTRSPVAGVIWQTVHYLVGLQRLGYDVYYVEEHARAPRSLMRDGTGDGSTEAAAFIDGVLRRFDLGDRWAYRALHADGRCLGMSEHELRCVYRSAAVIINLLGATEPRPEHHSSGPLVYLETDPVQLQIKLHDDEQLAKERLAQHDYVFTFGENYGNADCTLPLTDQFTFRPTRQPVVLDLWEPNGKPLRGAFTTVGSWFQWRTVTLDGEIYKWNKRDEFLKFFDLPRRTGQEFELALSNCEEDDRQALERGGWKVRDGLGLSVDLDTYRDYILTSKGEFTVAKDQNVRLRSGWFSDRSATYLAAGKPVVTQTTGFENMLPTGEGLFGFSTMDEIVEAIERINGQYERHSRAAREIARDYFSYDVVLGQLLTAVGL